MSTNIEYVIADWDTPELAQACSLSIHERGHSHTVIVDAKAKNLGYSAALNLGARRTSSDIICFLNADTAKLQDDQAIVDLFERDPKLGIVGPLQVDADDLIVHAGIVPHEPDGTVWDIDLRHRCWLMDSKLMTELTSGTYLRPMVSGSVLYMRRECWTDIGGWPEALRFYHEDQYVCYAARHRGWNVVYTGDVTWRHYHEGSPLDRDWRIRQLAIARQQFIYLCGQTGIPLNVSRVPDD